MSWSVQTFRLVSNRTDPGLFCAKNELTLGGAPLLIRTNLGFKPRPLGELQEVFDAAYGADAAVDAESRLPCLQSIARALDSGEFSYAAMLSLMLRLPDIDPSGMARLGRVTGAVAMKYDDDETRDRQGRWTSGGGRNSQGTPERTGGGASPNAATGQGSASHSTGQWPDIHRENPNIVPARALPFPLLFPPLIGGGGVAGSRKPKDDDIIYPTTMPQTDAGQSANDNATTDAHAANDNRPRACPDPSYEPDSTGRTAEQLRYQAQISGLSLGFEVVLNRVGYDGCRSSDNTMLEAKNTAPWFSFIPEDQFKKFKEYTQTVQQAFRQNYSSGGRRVEWHFSDPAVASYWRREFRRLEYKNIDVKYTPYDELYNYNLDKSLALSFY